MFPIHCLQRCGTLVLMLSCLMAAGCATRAPIATGTFGDRPLREVPNRVPREAATRPHFGDATGALDARAMAAGDEPLPPPPPGSDRLAMAASAAAGTGSAHCPFGEPVPRRGLDFGATERIVRDGYALLHSADLKTPYWVCETYTARSLQTNVERGSLSFKADPLLHGARALPRDYEGSARHETRAGPFPVDIGHMAPAEAHSSSQARIEDTFYLSNAVPQHRAMNRGQWARLEACARTTGPVRGAKWVISGPMIYTERDVQFVTVDTIGDGVVIPTHTWKILVYRTPAGELRAWAAVMPNQVLPENSALNDFVASIDAIEDATGFDFLPELSAAEQRALERPVHPLACQ